MSCCVQQGGCLSDMAHDASPGLGVDPQLGVGRDLRPIDALSRATPQFVDNGIDIDHLLFDGSYGRSRFIDVEPLPRRLVPVTLRLATSQSDFFDDPDEVGALEDTEVIARSRLGESQLATGLRRAHRHPSQQRQQPKPYRVGGCTELLNGRHHAIVTPMNHDRQISLWGSKPCPGPQPPLLGNPSGSRSADGTCLRRSARPQIQQLPDLVIRVCLSREKRGGQNATRPRAVIGSAARSGPTCASDRWNGTSRSRPRLLCPLDKRLIGRVHVGQIA